MYIADAQRKVTAAKMAAEAAEARAEVAVRRADVSVRRADVAVNSGRVTIAKLSKVITTAYALYLHQLTHCVVLSSSTVKAYSFRLH
jgi:hypothetical protein